MKVCSFKTGDIIWGENNGSPLQLKNLNNNKNYSTKEVFDNGTLP